MNLAIDNVLFIYLLPFILAIFCFGTYYLKIQVSKQCYSIISIVFSIIQFLFAIKIFQICNFSQFETPDISIEWFRLSDSALFLGVFIDKISSIILLIISIFFVSINICLFSNKKYIEGVPLYYGCINIINFLIIAFTLSSNVLQSFADGILISIFAYIFLSYNSHTNINKISKKFLIQNRIADSLILLGIIILTYFVINYPISEGRELLAYSNLYETAADFYIYLSDECFLLTSILFITGFALKIGIFPFHTIYEKIADTTKELLPLILLTTMIITGIVFTIRLLPLFQLSNTVIKSMITVGTISALFSALFAAANNDPKRIILYGLISQASVIFATTSVSTNPLVCIYLFNSIISLVVMYLIMTYNIGKTKNTNSVIMFIFSLIAIFSQITMFFAALSQDGSIFQMITDARNTLLIISFISITLLTSYYLFKLLYIIFSSKSENEEYNPDKKPLMLTISLLTLSLIGIYLYVLNVNNFAILNLKNSNEIMILLISLIIGNFFAYIFINKLHKDKQSKIGYFLSNGMFFDKIYDFISENVVGVFANITKNIDKYLINSSVNSIGYTTNFLSYLVSLSQNGNIQSYISYGIFVIICLLIIYSVISISIGGLF
ncbi:MAG: proton-conducting transporter membrane subunit [Candidatus Gastranaerophilaceae bacterium]